MKLFIERKVSKNGVEYSVLGAETYCGDIILTMEDDKILSLSDMRKSELVSLSERVYISDDFDIKEIR